MVTFGQHLRALAGHPTGDRVTCAPITQRDDRATAPGAAMRGSLETARYSELSPAPGARVSEWHVIMLVTTGQGSHTLDFVTHACRPGTLLWGRPGQVHQFGRQPGFDATLLAFAPALPERSLAPEALRHLIDDPFARTCWQPTGEDEEAIVADVAQIAVDQARFAASGTAGGLAESLLAHELAVLLMRVAALAGPAPTGPTARLLMRLRAEIERDVAYRRVEDYAARLGCSVRTLTRACLAATGRSAKHLVDERIALAAKRLLAATDQPVAEIGRRLGFDEPTNFGRFFAREVGCSPGAFRAEARLAPAMAIPEQRSALPGRLVSRMGQPLR